MDFLVTMSTRFGVFLAPEGTGRLLFYSFCCGPPIRYRCLFFLRLLLSPEWKRKGDVQTMISPPPFTRHLDKQYVVTPNSECCIGRESVSLLRYQAELPQSPSNKVARVVCYWCSRLGSIGGFSPRQQQGGRSVPQEIIVFPRHSSLPCPTSQRVALVTGFLAQKGAIGLTIAAW
ncbi:hypothetical protein VTK56DRAFT_173 [Thermocarpiscus australiensis]